MRDIEREQFVFEVVACTLALAALHVPTIAVAGAVAKSQSIRGVWCLTGLARNSSACRASFSFGDNLCGGSMFQVLATELKQSAPTIPHLRDVFGTWAANGRK